MWFSEYVLDYGKNALSHEKLSGSLGELLWRATKLGYCQISGLSLELLMMRPNMATGTSGGSAHLRKNMEETQSGAVAEATGVSITVDPQIGTGNSDLRAKVTKWGEKNFPCWGWPASRRVV